MKRSTLITGVTVIQLLLGLFYMGVSILLLYLTRSPAIRQGHDPAATIWGLKLAAGMIGPLALLAIAGAYGLRKNRLWGWWISFLNNFGVASALAYGAIDDGWNNLDPELIVPALVLVIPVVLLLLPAVRRFYWRSSGPQLQPS